VSLLPRYRQLAAVIDRFVLLQREPVFIAPMWCAWRLAGAVLPDEARNLSGAIGNQRLNFVCDPPSRIRGNVRKLLNSQKHFQWQDRFSPMDWRRW
jgi:hypothetical protein